ncbi:MAG: hypothetical protein KQH59_14850 [Desulfobulbaceae bacterium]|nr:hypothetical protein [Desulfobulbaceae bacterium]
MKQLLIIVVIFLAVTAGTSLYLLLSGDQTAPENIALTVNGNHFTIDEIDSYFSGRFPTDSATSDGHHGDRDLMLTAFAEERVLIQEAQRLKIDQDPDFRDKIQRYYEYSLISALRNRQEQHYRNEIAADSATIEQRIDHFLDLYGRPITFRLSNDTEPTTLPFDQIPNMYKTVIADLKTGQTRPVILTGNAVNEITLVDIGKKVSEPAASPDRDKIKQMLLDYQTGARLNTWIENLIDNASITYPKEH